MDDLRTWIKPTAKSLTDRACNDAKTVGLNREDSTEDAAIAAGWYPTDGQPAGSAQTVMPVPDWLTVVQAEQEKAEKAEKATVKSAGR